MLFSHEALLTFAHMQSYSSPLPAVSMAYLSQAYVYSYPSLNGNQTKPICFPKETKRSAGTLQKHSKTNVFSAKNQKKQSFRTL